MAKFRLAKTKKHILTTHCVGEAKGTHSLLHYWWECNLVQPSQRTTGSYLTKLHMHSATSFLEFSLEIHLQYVKIHMYKVITGVVVIEKYAHT